MENEGTGACGMPSGRLSLTHIIATNSVWPLPSYWPATGPSSTRLSWFGFPSHLRTKGQGMASVESVPAYLQPGVLVSQPPHLEGDPSLATEILPGPPSLASIQQAGLPRKDHKKAVVSFSYLPAADPGTTYTTHFAMSPLSAVPVDMDGTRRKRSRLDKGYVVHFHHKQTLSEHSRHCSESPLHNQPPRNFAPQICPCTHRPPLNSAESSRSQRASARSLAGVAPSSEPIVVSEATASSSHGLSDFDPQLLPLDSDDAMVSRATSRNGDDSPPQSVEPPSKRQRARQQKDKGKGKEREKEPAVKVKEEPTVVSLSEHAPASFVSPFLLCEHPFCVGLNLRPAQRGPLLCLPLAGRAGVLRWLYQGLPLAMSRSSNGGKRPSGGRI